MSQSAYLEGGPYHGKHMEIEHDGDSFEVFRQEPPQTGRYIRQATGPENSAWLWRWTGWYDRPEPRESKP